MKGKHKESKTIDEKGENNERTTTRWHTLR